MEKGSPPNERAINGCHVCGWSAWLDFRSKWHGSVYQERSFVQWMQIGEWLTNSMARMAMFFRDAHGVMAGLLAHVG